MPLTGSVAWPTSATRLAIALCAFALLATASATGDRPVAGADLSGQINANRSYMEYAQKTMLAQDRAILSIQNQRTGVKKAYKEARATLRQLRTWYKATLKMVATRQARLAEAEGRYASAAEAPDPKEYRDRVSKLRKDVRDALGQKQTLASRVRAAERTFKASRARLNSLNRAQKAAIARREGAEATLGARIVEMQRLAATRAETQSTVSLASGSSAFSWPTTGRITQPYGCTGFNLNPRRGSCRHFHDGIDVVDSYGTPVRSVAVGVVAYSGWNPWDEGGRAWIVVVVHPDGYVSRYGHMIPRQPVRAGDVVHTGQIIGRMGSTGKSTGTHLHFELLRNGSDVNPVEYLPTGVVRIDKSTTREGRAAQASGKSKATAKSKAKPKPKPKVKLPKFNRATKFPDEKPTIVCQPGGGDKGSAAVDACVAALSTTRGDRHAPPVSRADPATEGETTTEPGVPLPYRGASPDPS